MIVQIDDQETERLEKYEEAWKSIFKLKNDQLEVYEKIIKDTLAVLPVGYIPSHTAENIPEMVKGWVARAVEAENDLEEVRDNLEIARENLTTIQRKLGLI